MTLARMVALAVTLTLTGAHRAAAETAIPLSHEDASIRVIAQDTHQIEVEYRFSHIDCRSVQTARGTMTSLGMPGLSHSQKLGSPMLPVSRRLIAVPLGARVAVEIIEEHAAEVDLRTFGVQAPVVPTQAPIPKHLRPEEVPFAFDEVVYGTAGYGDQPVASVEEVGILRGVRLFMLVVEPVRYDPVAGTVRAHDRLRVKVSFEGGDVVQTERLRATTWSPDFEALYRRALLNYQPPSRLDDLTRYPVKYVVVSHPMFASQLQPFVEWKRMKGFDVVVGYVGDPGVGTTAASIKAFLRALYDSATPVDPAPSFVLLVGDVGQVPAWQGTTDQHVTDLHYVTLAGDDFLPEMYIGRFSANTPAELQPQIDKTLEYERFQMPDPSYLAEVVMIAGMDATFSQTWANGQINYGTTYYFNEAHGLTSYTYLYPESGSHEADIIAHVSGGVGYANYTAHGWEQGWADPAFGIPDIQGLQNLHRYGTVVGNACLTNAFNIPTCFGEAWLRAENRGAIGYIGAANSSLWDEDFWWGVGAGSVTPHPTYEATGPGAYDGMFHDHGEPFPEWFTTQYAIIMAGCLAVVEAGSPEANYYWEIYALMGDPSLATWLGVPTANTVAHAEGLTVGDTSVTVDADPWSYAALGKEGTLLAAGLVDGSGRVVLNFDPITSVDPLSLVVTRQNRVPVVHTLNVAPSQGPWVMTSAVSLDDSQGGNGNGQADFGETLALTLTERNIGYESAVGVTLTIAALDSFLAIEDSVEYYGDIAPGEESTIEQGFRIAVATGVPNGRVIRIDASAADTQGHVWPSHFDIIAYAPILAVAEVTVCDQDNGALDPGETADIEVRIDNSGGAAAQGVVATLSSDDPFVTIPVAADSIGTAHPGDSVIAAFPLSASPSTPQGHTAVFVVSVTGDNYAVNDTFCLRVGRVVEDFETGDFSAYPWVMGGNAPWTITSVNPYEGAYAAVSSDIGNSQSSSMMLGLAVLEDGAISFRYRVSSEPGYDFFRFLIDGIVAVEASGSVAWTEAVCPVSAGSHTFTWRYEKDQSVSMGSDCAWVDHIVFPALEDQASFPDIAVSPDSIEVTVSSQPHVENLTIANAGEAGLAYSIRVTTGEPQGGCSPPLKRAKGETDPRTGSPAIMRWGGPDGHGYRWVDSDEPGGPDYDWVDIGQVGACPGTSDDANYGPFDLGFSFPFYGEEYTTVRLCTNGWLSFESSVTAFENEQIPSGAEPNALVAPLWTDLDPSSGGRIRYYADAASARFIAQWDSVPPFSDTPDTTAATFQVILYADGRILFQFARLVGEWESYTVGTEDAAGFDGLDIAFNQAYLHDSLAVLIEPGEPWLVVAPAAGTVAPGATQTVSVSCTPSGLPEGAYGGRITISSNDPDQPSLDIPVLMHVTAVSAHTLPVPGNVVLEPTPNPFRMGCRLGTGVQGAEVDEVRIYDLRGALVWRWERSSDGDEAPVWKPGASVGSGMYAVRATVGDRRVATRIVYLK